tara:strand:+ start:428 stop:1075 length:648 start_codon:yes stop_codon:yes gene_type:complete
MSNKDIFQRYIDLADVIGRMFAPFVEVIVHNLQTPENSIIAIYNGHITGRKIGDGASDLGLKRLNNQVPDKIINYPNQAPNGDKLKSSTLAIRNHQGQIIGSFGINMKIDYFAQVAHCLESLIATQSADYLPQKEDYCATNVTQKIESEINNYRLTHAIGSATLARSQRDKLIEYLYEKNMFELKHAMTIIATLLKISRPTLYKRYNQLKLKLTS